MLKVKILIKNTLSKLIHIHQRRGVLRTRNMEISTETAKDHYSLFVFTKNPIPEVWVPNMCHKIEVRKFSIHKLKQKTAKEVKN